MPLKRRNLLKATLAGSALTLPLLTPSVFARQQPRVVVIGGGFAGATAARYLSMWAPEFDVVMIEQKSHFISCPQSNMVLSGHRTLADLTRDYAGLDKRSIQRVEATVRQIDAEKKRVYISSGESICYDRLIIAPGVDMVYDSLPMLTPDIVNTRIPHAWKAGPQTQLLRDQLLAMPQGGRVVMTIPNTPFRCPPGPYERACQIADYLKHHNPRGKLIILDANANIVSKKALFESVWHANYADWIEYLPSNALVDINVDTLQVESVFDEIQADVLNVIPPQKAGKVAELAGVVNVDKRWCAVDFRTYESTAVKGVHVIGDAVASTLPKSGHIANAQAKICAAAVIALLNEQPVIETPVFGNTCYSFMDGQTAGHVAAVFRYDPFFKNIKTCFKWGFHERIFTRPSRGSSNKICHIRY
jgi:NADPH-dependent 2,4-dienoyl-CoA reductase/sulfur reductase-like enzyme